MIENATYNKIKLLNHVSELIWFIEKHANAEKADDTYCVKKLNQLVADLEKQPITLKQSLTCCKKLSC